VSFKNTRQGPTRSEFFLTVSFGESKFSQGEVLPTIRLFQSERNFTLTFAGNPNDYYNINFEITTLNVIIF